MSQHHARARLDPRAPLVLDTRELGRRPGSMRHVRRTVQAPGGWSLEMVSVPTGSDVDLDLRLESVMDGVLVSGEVTVSVAGECGRCLEPFEGAETVDVQELYAYEPPADDPEAPVLDGDFIDAEPLVRDAVVLALPLTPLCRSDCPGLCATCGVRLADVEPDHAHDESDPRWGALAGVFATDAAASNPTVPTDQTVTDNPQES